MTRDTARSPRLSELSDPIRISLAQSAATRRRREDQLLLVNEELRASERLFHEIFQSAQVGLCLARDDTVIVRVNPEFARIFGYEPAELEGRSSLDLFPEDVREAALRRFRERLDGENEPGLWQIRRRTGEIRCIRTWGMHRFEQDGRQYLLGSFQDVTDQIAAEEKLAEAARVQRALYHVVDRLQHGASLAAIYSSAIDTILEALRCDRASILLFDETRVMRFVSWRGLSDGYRQATEGHSPWKPDERDPRPLAIENVETADLDERLRQILRSEGIRALCFIPLVVDGKLIGKFMAYFDRPHLFTEKDLELGLTLAGELAFGIERKRTEDVARLHEDRLRLATQTGKTGIWDWDLSTDRVWWTDSLYRIYGLDESESDATSRRFTELVHPDDRDRVTATIQRSLQNAEPYEVEFRAIRPDGRVVWLFTSATVLSRNGAPLRVLGTTVDVTKRKRAEFAVRESEARFRQLADAMPQIVWTARPDGFIDYYNERWYEFTGFDRNVFGQESWQPILHPDDVSRCLDTYFGCIRAGRSYQIEYRFKDRVTGGYRWFMGRAVPIRNEKGEIEKWFGTCTDIDDTKRAGEDLKAAARAKDEFLAMLSHELRNPLGAITNAAGVLRRLERAEPVAEMARDIIERQTAHLTRLVDDLLDVSRIASGKIALESRRIAVADAITMAAETIRPAIDARRQQLVVSFAPVAIEVCADTNRLAQAIGNLLHNASKYGHDGSRIWLSLERQAGHAVIRVRDEGIGIPSDLLVRVFEPFVQGGPAVERAFDRSQRGLGLGLTLVKTIIELHGGSVEASSEGEGRGSEFTIRLPVVKEKNLDLDRLARTKTPPAETGSFRRILIVDDSVDSAEGLAALLQLDGHSVRTSHDGESALAAAAEFRPDLVLLDIGLPGMDGYEIARRLRDTPGLPGMELIAVTGYGRDEDRRKALEAGFDRHVAKPIRVENLRSVIEPARRS